MSATAVSTRIFTKEEIKTLNENSLTVRGRGLFFGGSVTKYSDGRCEATYALSDEHGAKVNAKRIGEKILEIFDFIDEVWHDGICVAKR